MVPRYRLLLPLARPVPPPSSAPPEPGTARSVATLPSPLQLGPVASVVVSRPLAWLGAAADDACAPPPAAPGAAWGQRRHYAAVLSPPFCRRLKVYNEVLARLCDLSGAGAVEISPVFEDALWAHFHRLPARHALDVDVVRAENVVMLQHLLEEARDPDRQPALSVRIVQSFCGADGGELGVPTDIQDRCFLKFQERAKKDPTYLKSFDF